ncbi:hypothetical protein AK830_g5335 [Neonectria ditissima]|uniref:Uncharacterized protein n=1 Tax=Neonectria ditissima TaxID=78410 RepID=A0A0P7BLC5_9HYPO|nr:hypothetical protein AK830_g5335 [Neonectria ditissima]
MEDQHPAVTHERGEFSRTVRRHKLKHPSFPPPRYFDNSAQKFLTKYALRELNRRNSKLPRTLKSHRPRLRTRSSTEDLAAHYDANGRKQLQRYARNGGPDLTDFEKPSRSSLSRRKRASTSEMTTKLIGPYNCRFMQHLTDHGIFPADYRYPDGRDVPEPSNKEALLQALAVPRASSSQLSEKDFQNFVKADRAAFVERDVVRFVIPLITGLLNNIDRTVSRGVRFANLEHLTDGSLAAAVPDEYYGAPPEQLHLKVRQELEHVIIPTSQKNFPISPNFFLEVKGPRGTPAVLQRQACYDGAMGTRGIHSLQSYASSVPEHNHGAYTISAAYSSGGSLKLYAHHLVHSSTLDGEVRTEFAMTQLRGFDLTDNLDTFREGLTAYRNAADWCKQQRDDAIKKANDKVFSTQSVSHESDTDQDESHPDLHRPAKRPRLERDSQKRRSSAKLGRPAPPASRHRPIQMKSTTCPPVVEEEEEEEEEEDDGDVREEENEEESL